MIANYRKNFTYIYKEKNISYKEICDEIDFVTEILTQIKPINIGIIQDLTKEQIELIKGVLEEHVETKKPLQYILGKAFFAGKIYYVNQDTLIPRPETEFLVDLCCQYADKNKNYKILDIGTGSGCIAVELALRIPKANITASDISKKAIDIAIKNASKYGVSQNISFIKSNLFSNIKDKFDIIVSNPPYIDYTDIEEVQQDVFDFEPHRALFAPDKGLYFYKKITEQSYNHLNANGVLAFEIGWKQYEKVAEIMKNKNFTNIEFVKDLEDIRRVISGIKN
ncbi:peptide chain release factor N(5)-glutamine methyltransferase [bacterium]|nr:peptide chain release factor N(5)-glutamine methyltransferase [bacterium]